MHGNCMSSKGFYLLQTSYRGGGGCWGRVHECTKDELVVTLTCMTPIPLCSIPSLSPLSGILLHPPFSGILDPPPPVSSPAMTPQW